MWNFFLKLWRYPILSAFQTIVLWINNECIEFLALRMLFHIVLVYRRSRVTYVSVKIVEYDWWETWIGIKGLRRTWSGLQEWQTAWSWAPGCYAVHGAEVASTWSEDGHDSGGEGPEDRFHSAGWSAPQHCCLKNNFFERGYRENRELFTSLPSTSTSLVIIPGLPARIAVDWGKKSKFKRKFCWACWVEQSSRPLDFFCGLPYLLIQG